MLITERLIERGTKVRRLKLFFMLVILLLIYIYTCYITFLPDHVILFQGEELNLGDMAGIRLEQKSKSSPNLQDIADSEITPVSTGIVDGTTQQVGQLEVSLNLFGKIPLKEVTVNVIPKTSVIPLGNAIGLKLYTDGVLVVGMSEIEGEDQNKYKPYQNSGIKEGDRIVQIDDIAITCTADLVNTVNSSKGKELEIKYIRKDSTLQTSIKPTKTNKNEYKLGLWVRDAAAGVGTATFYDPSSKMFGALGHGILDIDTSELISIAKGELVTTNILSIAKGEKGKPGEIRGSIEGGKEVGDVYRNTGFGIYGKVTNEQYLEIDHSKAMEVALREEIKQGKATILCDLQNGKIEEYEIEIQKLYLNNNSNNKSMLIKVTDPKLLEVTGGIIQGMSGSPIIQNGKFCGAVTHVLVNDPTTGYGVFGDMMLKQIKEVN